LEGIAVTGLTYQLSKILFKNQRSPAEVAPAPSRGHILTPPALLVTADLTVNNYKIL